MGRIVDRDAKFEREVWDRDEAIAFFAEPGSAGVTGQVLRVCGQSQIGA